MSEFLLCSSRTRVAQRFRDWVSVVHLADTSLQEPADLSQVGPSLRRYRQPMMLILLLSSVVGSFTKKYVVDRYFTLS